MKKLSGLFWLFWLLAFSSQAQRVDWQQEWAMPFPSTIGVYIHQHVGQGLITLAGSRNEGPSNANGYPQIFAQYDTAGTVRWQTLGRAAATGEQTLLPWGRGFVTVACEAAGESVYLQKLTAVGDTLLARRLPRSQVQGFPVSMLADARGFTVALLSVYYAPGSGNLLPTEYTLLRTDTSGVVQWVRRYPNPYSTSFRLGMAFPNQLLRVAGGRYLLTGIFQDTDAYRPYLLETDSLGRLRRQVLLPPLVGATENLQISRLWNNTLAVRDGSGYVFSGYATLGASGPYQAFVAKVNTALQLSWVAPLPAQRRPWLIPTSVREQPDATLLVAAADAPTAGVGGRTPWLYVYALSPGGQLLRRREIQATGYDWIWPYDWHPLAGDSALVVSGSARQAGPGGTQVAWVARFRPTLRPLSSAAPRGPVAPLAVYPNPAAGHAARVALPAGLPPGATLTVHDALGRELRRQLLPAAAPPAGFPLPLTGLVSGVYVVQLTAPDGRRWSARLLRQ